MVLFYFLLAMMGYVTGAVPGHSPGYPRKKLTGRPWWFELPAITHNYRVDSMAKPEIATERTRLSIPFDDRQRAIRCGQQLIDGGNALDYVKKKRCGMHSRGPT